MNETIKIETGKSISFENVASFRKKMKQSEIQIEVGRFVEFLKHSNAKKNGPMISATFGIEDFDGEQVIDIQFLFPIDRVFQSTEEYLYKSKFYLGNAIYKRHVGNPLTLQITYNEMLKYVEQEQLIQLSVAYNVNIDNEISNVSESIIDVYISINSNIL